MNDELLAEVDEYDRVIGPRPRGELHRLGLRHRAVHILVFDGEGRLFLQKRSPAKDINPGLWDTSAAGHVDFGENYDDCARRELEEELGIRQADGLEFLFKLTATACTGWEFVQVYRLRHLGELRPDPVEIDGFGWFAAEDIDARVAAGDATLTDSFRTLWTAYRSGRARNSA